MAPRRQNPLTRAPLSTVCLPPDPYTDDPTRQPDETPPELDDLWVVSDTEGDPVHGDGSALLGG